MNWDLASLMDRAAVGTPRPHPGPLPAGEREQRAWHVLDGVPDPEIPVISVRELGIVRDVRVVGGTLEVVLTPTYSGCPATEMIEQGVREALDAAGLGPLNVTTRLAPAWTTDWISDEGKRKMRQYGIAPPDRTRDAKPMVFVQRLTCPRCGSRDTERLSAFGSTACKSLHRCRACMEPFEHFKTI
jgi:ring-1,2-phenylacetyl-CoA epoxidase subunit PaaD